VGLLSSWFRKPQAAAVAPPVPQVRNMAPSPVPEAGSVRGVRGSSWQVQSVTPQSLTATRSTVVKRARAAHVNDALLRAAVGKLVAALVGTGIVPRSASPDPAVRKAADALFLKWTDEASTDPGCADFYAQQRAAVTEMLVGGEAFWRIRPRKRDDGLVVPVQVSLHTGDEVVDRSENSGTGRRVVQGCVLSPIGAVDAWLFRDPATQEERQVPAGSVVHLYDPPMPGALRGLPVAAPVLLKARELDLYTDATLVRQQLAAMYVAFLKRNGDATVDPITGDPVVSGGDLPTLSLHPGAFQELEPGEEIQFSEPPQATDFGEFWRAGVETIAGAFYGMPSWYLLGTTRGLESDRTMRVQLLAFRRQLAQAQHQVIAPALRQVYLAWFTAAVEAGALALPAGSKVADHAAVVFRAPRNEHLHPVQDAQAARDAVRNGQRSLSSVIAENGDDPAQVFAEIAADQKALDGLGLRVESDPRVPVGGSKAVA
jgi:lambda family phage portal protein